MPRRASRIICASVNAFRLEQLGSQLDVLTVQPVRLGAPLDGFPRRALEDVALRTVYAALNAETHGLDLEPFPGEGVGPIDDQLPDRESTTLNRRAKVIAKPALCAAASNLPGVVASFASSYVNEKGSEAKALLPTLMRPRPRGGPVSHLTVAVRLISPSVTS
jgi:hypothetical protein